MTVGIWAFINSVYLRQNLDTLLILVVALRRRLYYIATMQTVYSIYRYVLTKNVQFKAHEKHVSFQQINIISNHILWK